MKRRTTQPVVDLYGAHGRGPTKADAKAHAAGRIAKAFDEDWNYFPQTLRFPQGEIGLIFRTLEGWAYDILWPDESTKCHQSRQVATDRRAAERALRRDLAQHYAMSDSEGFDLLLEDDIQGHHEHARYVAFQHAYQRYAAEGRPDSECHRLACETMWQTA